MKFLVAILGFVSSTLAIHGDQIVESWSKIASEILERNGTDYMSYTNHPVIFEIIETKDFTAIDQMVKMKSNPLVQSVGLRCVQEVRPEESVKSALRILFDAERPLMPYYAPIYESLTNITDADAFLAAFTEISAESPHDVVSYIGIVNGIPVPLLKQWIQSNPPGVYLQNLAIVIDRIIESDLESGQSISDEIKAIVLQMGRFPGFARGLYLEVIPKDTDGYETVFRAFLCDDDVSTLELTGAVARNREYVKQSIDTKELSCSATRKLLIEEALAR